MRFLLFYFLSITTVSAQTVAILAPDVACRSSASREGTLVAELGFPTVLEVVPTVAPTNRWVHVKMEEGLHCFVSELYTTPFDEQKPEQTLQAIADHTLKWVRYGDEFNFERLNLVHNLFEIQWRGINIQESPQLQLQELQLLKAITHTFHVCYRDGTRVGCLPQNIQNWVQRYQDRITYHEIGGAWIVEPDAFWLLHDQYQNTPSIADEIAWVASNHSWTGECEGFVPCYLGSRRGLEYDGKLEYLKHYPNGKYAIEAGATFLEKLSRLLNMRNEYYCQNYGRGDHVELKKRTDEIATIIEMAQLDLTAKDAIKSILNGISRPCD